MMQSSTAVNAFRSADALWSCSVSVLSQFMAPAIIGVLQVKWFVAGQVELGLSCKQVFALQWRRLLPSSRTRGSISFQVGSFSALSLSINIGNQTHRSTFPHNFSSSFSQKVHLGENNCIEAYKDYNLRGEVAVKALSLGVVLHLKWSWFLVNIW